MLSKLSMLGTTLSRLRMNIGGTGAAALVAAAMASLATACAAAPPGNCTAQGGVLSNAGATCTFTVTTTGDSLSGDGFGYVALAGSLRRAINDANAWGNYGNIVSGNSVINIDASLATQTISLAHALPALMSDIEINGPPGGVTIDGGSTDFATGVRCFFVSGLPVAGSGPAANPNDGMPQAIHVKLSTLTVQNCRARGGTGSGGGLGAGGGLFVNQQATVDLQRVNFLGNRAIGGTGAGGSRGGGGMGGSSIYGYSGGGGIGGSAEASNGGGGGAGIGGPSGFSTGSGGFGIDTSDTDNASRGVGGISPNQGFATAEAGGANGGGGGTGGLAGDGYGGGGTTAAGGGIGGNFYGGVGGGGAYAATEAVAGPGGFGGGGGAAHYAVVMGDLVHAGANGGFGGGGGAGSYCGCSTPGIAGAGGFGGGGGFGLNGGAGGFGSGAGSAGSSSAAVAKSGFGAADPTASNLAPANGTAMGGAIFAVNGAVINFIGDGNVTGNRLSDAVPRTSPIPAGNNGLLLGSGMFLQGNGTMTMTQGVGETLQLFDDIVDQTGTANAVSDPNPYTYPSGGPFNGTNWSYSSRGRWALIKNGPGTLVLTGGFSTYSGQNVNNAGTVLVQNTALGYGSWTNHARIVFGTQPFDAPPLYAGIGNGFLNDSTFTQSSTGTLRMRISGPSCQADLLVVQTMTTLGGTFWIDVGSGCVPSAAQMFTLISTYTVVGTFDRIVVTGMPAGRTLLPVYEESLFRLQEAAGSSADLLNVDASDVASRYQAATDGVLIMRYLFGTRGAALTSGALGTGASRDASQIEAHVAGLMPLLDVDGDGQTLATTDGLMILRRMLGLSGAALTAGAKAGPASDADVAAAIDALKP